MEHILHHAAVVVTGLLTALGQLIGLHKPHLAGPLAHHGDVIPGDIIKHQHLAENAACLQMLQNRTAAVLIDTLHYGAAAGQNADGLASAAEVVDNVLCAKIPFTHAEAIPHAVPFIPADSFEDW